jgi:hypothetical protein
MRYSQSILADMIEARITLACPLRRLRVDLLEIARSTETDCVQHQDGSGGASGWSGGQNCWIGKLGPPDYSPESNTCVRSNKRLCERMGPRWRLPTTTQCSALRAFEQTDWGTQLLSSTSLRRGALPVVRLSLWQVRGRRGQDCKTYAVEPVL